MSRAMYLKRLEQDLSASKKVINELTQEIYELREQLKTEHQVQSTYGSNQRRISMGS